MQAFHNDPAIKEKYLGRVTAHQVADEIIHGTYWEDGKGCAVGCTIHSERHGNYETELGIPRVLARLEDRIFEGMPNGRAKEWPVKFLSVIRVGSDLSSVWPKFAVWLLTDKTDGVIKYAKTDEQRKAIKKVSDLYAKVAKGGTVKIEEWQKARSAAAAYAADAAAAAAAYAAAYAADAAAYAAAYAADAAAADAAYAAYAAARSQARENMYIKESEKLLELLAAA